MTDPDDVARYPWRVPGYGKAMDAAQDAVTSRYDGYWEGQAAELAVETAVPILIDQMALAAEDLPYEASDRIRIAEWLRGMLISRRQVREGTYLDEHPQG